MVWLDIDVGGVASIDGSWREWLEWFSHGAGDHGRPRHLDDHRDFGFVPERSLLGFAPFTLGFLALLQWYPSARWPGGGGSGSLWTDPAKIAALTLIPIVFLALTPFCGMGGPDAGWGADPPKINYSLSHLIDCDLLVCLMSSAWVYPCTLLWATEFRVDWLRETPPGGLITYALWKGGLFRGDWLQVCRRIALLIWHLGFTGFLTITDSTNWFLHTIMVYSFAAALVVHLLGVIAASALAGARISSQVLLCFSALAGLVAFIVLNQPMKFTRPGVGWWYWFAEVWALASVLLFTPARLLLDEGAAISAAPTLGGSKSHTSLLERAASCDSSGSSSDEDPRDESRPSASGRCWKGICPGWPP